MSGICGIWGRDDAWRADEVLALMSSALAFPAPAHITQHVDGAAGLAVAARFARQQIYWNERVQVACDAHLYNQAELTAWTPPPAGGKGSMETAALCAGLYDRFGPDFVEKLRGAFSVLLWDRVARRLMAAVDGFGVNRLVYCDTGKSLLVATRIQALANSGQIAMRVNPRAVANVLNYTSNLAPGTIFEGVERLIPGGLLVAGCSGASVRKYWDMRYGQNGDTKEEYLCQELERRVGSSVAACCQSDSFSRTGAFLSGGTDSSTVVGMMSRMGRGPVNAFSIGFRERHFDELEYARIAAAKFEARHHTYLVGPEDCFEALPQIVRCFDEPYANSSAIPTYFCARLASENGVKVLLAGDGGDELFGGNERYLTDHIFEIYQGVPRVLRKALIEPALRAIPNKGGLISKARSYTERSNLPRVERYFSYNLLLAHPPAEVFETGFLEALEDYSILDVPSRYYEQAPARDHLDRLLYVDVKLTLGDNDLPKVICVSELAGVEPRFPFLDRAVAEFSGSIPARLKVKGFEKRYLFKQAFRNLLPAQVIGKKKHGFGIPVSVWLKSDRRLRELTHDTLLSARARERGYFRRQFMEDLFRWHEADTTTYYGDCLWPFLMLELWHRQFVDERARATA